MKEDELKNTFLDVFKVYTDSMNEVVSEKEPIAQSGKERLYFRVFSCARKENNPLEKISLSTWEDVKMKNKDDANVLDLTQAIVATVIPKDGVPLPICLIEACFHLGKYVYCAADLAPLSTDESYRNVFCKPVQELRKKHEELPGLLPGVPDRRIESFTSGGMLRGEVDIKHQETVMEWLLDYVNLYLKFIRERESYSVLSSPSSIEEGRRRKTALCDAFKKTTAMALSGVPGLYSEELAQKLGEMHF